MLMLISFFMLCVTVAFLFCFVFGDDSADSMEFLNKPEYNLKTSVDS